jgi:NAD(P)-dependent dehydrogenase (short-subunit alcohol dehydrogenase family)
MNRVAVVTGAGSGIGRSAALAFLRSGYSVVLAGRRSESLNQTLNDAGDGASALAIPTDVADPDAVHALFAKTKEVFGQLDVLFNNAGISGPRVPFEHLSFEDWQSVVLVNLNGVFLCAQEAYRMMKDQTPQGGRIINNGSISAHVPRPNSVPYTATKHAVTGLTKSLSLDGRKYNIACSQIDIGNAATALTEKMKKGTVQANGEIAVEPRMDVEHAANAVVYMAGLPLDVNIQFMTIMATSMPYIGRG